MTVWKTMDSAPPAEEIMLSNGEDVCTGQFINRRWVASVNGETIWEGSSDRGGLKDVDFDPTHWAPKPAPPTR